MAISEQRLNDLETFDWDTRKQRGDATEQQFIELIRGQYQLHVAYAGQHLHEPGSQLARHFPDIFIMECGAFVQIKDGTRSKQWPHVIGEKSSIDACRDLHKMGNRVWAIWKYPDGSFHGNSIELLVTDGYISSESRSRGSGTPAYKIRKTSLCALADLVYRQEALFGGHQ